MSQDIDWDNGILAGDGSDSELEPEHGFQVEVAAPAEAAVSLYQPRAAAAARKSRWTVKLPAPQRWSADQGVIAAARMRDARSRQLTSVRAHNSKAALKDALGKCGLWGC